MNRREVLQRVAVLMGGAISAPALFGVLNGYAKEAGPGWKPAVLGAEELAVVSRIVDIMIPRTDIVAVDREAGLRRARSTSACPPLSTACSKTSIRRTRATASCRDYATSTRPHARPSTSRS